MEWADLKKNNSRTKSIKKILIIISILFAGFLTGTVAFGLMFYGKEDNSNNNYNPINPIGGSETPVKLDNRVSFLLMGADTRPGDDSFNADTLIVASVDPDTKLISLLSIPRDTRVEFRGSRFLKINSIVMYSGIPELMNQVTKLTGIPLDGYVMTNFEGFKSIIDTLGGIDMYVERDMYKVTGDKTDGYIDLKQGDHRLTGSQALQYSRWRGDSLADISRTARQQNVLKAVAKEMMQVSTLTKIPKLVPQLMDAIQTDLSVADILKLSKVATAFDSSNVISQTLPGVFLDFDEISYWEVNVEQAKQTSKNLLLGITTDRVVNHKVIDLLDPDIKAHITVPGNKKDPNGVRSPGHEDEEPTDTDEESEETSKDTSDNTSADISNDTSDDESSGPPDDAIPSQTQEDEIEDTENNDGPVNESSVDGENIEVII